MKNLKFIFIRSVFLVAPTVNAPNGSAPTVNAPNGSAQNGNAHETVSLRSWDSGRGVINGRGVGCDLDSNDSSGLPYQDKRGQTGVGVSTVANQEQGQMNGWIGAGVPPVANQGQDQVNGQIGAGVPPVANQGRGQVNGQIGAGVSPVANQGRGQANGQIGFGALIVLDEFQKIWYQYITNCANYINHTGGFHVSTDAINRGDFSVINEPFFHFFCRNYDAETRQHIEDSFKEGRPVLGGPASPPVICGVIEGLSTLSTLASRGEILRSTQQSTDVCLRTLINNIFILDRYPHRELALLLNVAGFCVNCLNENSRGSADVFFVHKWLEFCCAFGKEIPSGNDRNSFRNQLECIILVFSDFLGIVTRGVHNSGVSINRGSFMKDLNSFMTKTLCVVCSNDFDVVCPCSVADQGSWFPQDYSKLIYFFRNGVLEDLCDKLVNGLRLAKGLRIIGPFKDDVNDPDRCFWVALELNGWNILLALGGGQRISPANVYNETRQYQVVPTDKGTLRLVTNDKLPPLSCANDERPCGRVCLSTNNSDYDVGGFWNRMGQCGHYLWLTWFSIGLLGSIVCDSWFLANWHSGNSKDVVLQSFGGVFTWIFGGSLGFGVSCTTVMRLFFGGIGQKARWYYESDGLDASKGRIVRWFRDDTKGVQKPRFTYFDCGKKGVAFCVLLGLAGAGMVSTLGVLIAWIVGAPKFNYGQDFAMGFFLFVGGLLLGVFAGYVFNYFREKSIWMYDNRSISDINHEPIEEAPQLPSGEHFPYV